VEEGIEELERVSLLWRTPVAPVRWLAV
jgi:hypothetical protein